MARLLRRHGSTRGRPAAGVERATQGLPEDDRLALHTPRQSKSFDERATTSHSTEIIILINSILIYSSPFRRRIVPHYRNEERHEDMIQAAQIQQSDRGPRSWLPLIQSWGNSPKLSKMNRMLGAEKARNHCRRFTLSVAFSASPWTPLASKVEPSFGKAGYGPDTLSVKTRSGIVQ